MFTDLSEVEARAEYEALRARRDAAAQKRDTYDRQVRGYDQMIGGLALIFPAVTECDTGADLKMHDPHRHEAQEEDGPGRSSLTTREAALKVLREAGGDWMTVRKIAETIKGRGWVESNNIDSLVRRALGRQDVNALLETGAVDGRTTAYRIALRTPTGTGVPVDAGTPGPAPTSGLGGDDHEAHQNHRDDLPRRNGDRGGGAPVGDDHLTLH